MPFKSIPFLIESSRIEADTFFRYRVEQTKQSKQTLNMDQSSEQTKQSVVDDAYRLIPEDGNTGHSNPSVTQDSDQDMDIQRWTQQVHGEITNFMAQRQEKYIFIWSVVNLCISCYAIGGNWFSGALAWYYSIKFPIMIITRYITYKQLSWQWFLLDFCYFSNMLLLVFLWINPDPQLFCMVFAITNGPLLWAILVFHNEFVFHSLDKSTSLLIHITPAIITYILRWKETSFWDIDQRWEHNICSVNSFEDSDDGCANWRNMVLWPFLFAVGHQILYYVLVQCVFYKTIVNDKNSWTMYRYMFRKSQQKGPAWKLINVCGKKGRIYIFGTIWVIYATLCFLPTLMMYRYEWLHFGVIVVCLVGSIRNGADFYGKVYAKRDED
eukprot:79571_1